MTSPGKYLRWLCLFAFISLKINFLIHGSVSLKNKEGEMAGIFVCESSNNVMTQCTGLEDDTTCGYNIQCIQSSCGRPLFPRIGMSYAGSTDPFDENAATSTTSFITALSLLYSLVPYMLLVYYILHFLALGNVVPLTRLGLMGFVELTNEALLKNIARQPRPTGSCLYFHSFGMPSGHAANSIGLLTFILLEYFLYHPTLYAKTSASTNYIEEVECESPPLNTDYIIFTWGHGWHQKRLIQSDSNCLAETMLSSQENLAEVGGLSKPLQQSYNPTSELEAPSMGQSSFSSIAVESEPRGNQFKSNWLDRSYGLLWITLLLPVPLSRVHLHDHSQLQILVGSLVGMVLGCIWYFCIIRGCLFRSANSREVMMYMVSSPFGKWIGLNFGVGPRMIQAKCN